MMNPVQIELLHAMAGLYSEEDLLSQKRFLVAFFAQCIDAGMESYGRRGNGTSRHCKICLMSITALRTNETHCT